MPASGPESDCINMVAQCGQQTVLAIFKDQLTVSSMAKTRCSIGLSLSSAQSILGPADSTSLSGWLSKIAGLYNANDLGGGGTMTSSDLFFDCHSISELRPASWSNRRTRSP